MHTDARMHSLSGHAQSEAVIVRVRVANTSWPFRAVPGPLV